MILPEMNRRRWVTLNISIGVYMSTLDASIVNISLPTIIQSLNTHLTAVAWVVMAYLIVITGCLLLMGRLSDLFGQRKIYLLGFLTFTVGSALCGFSPTIYFLIGSRMLQGLGASALMANGPAILTAAFPEKERGQALGIVGSVVSAGFLTGPILGGFLVEHLGWRSVFFINLPIGAIGIYLSSKVLERTVPTGKTRVDLWGALLLFFFVTSLLLFLNRMAQGSTPLLWLWLFFNLLCFSLFIMVELRSPSPLVDLKLFRRRLFISSLGASFLSFWMSAAHTFVIPFFLQSILEFSPSKVGMLIFPVALTVMVMAPFGGRFSDRVGVKIPATMGLALTSLAVFSFTLLKPGVNDLNILWRQIVLGIGISLFNPANNSAILGSLPREKVGLASSFLALSRNLGMVIGVAFAEMVIAFRLPAAPLERAKAGPSLEGIQDVWKLVLIIGLTAILISWARESKSNVSGGK
ncbi:MAG: MFS transporter [Deltaproteobacteria bacterium CG03_land_8_20_14_0_80_45_14]|nr:MAG: MFS transporter [Deltaproteobacteria bacterium CG03_land_8_20_14_0_80_45_14]